MSKRETTRSGLDMESLPPVLGVMALLVVVGGVLLSITHLTATATSAMLAAAGGPATEVSIEIPVIMQLLARLASLVAENGVLQAMCLSSLLGASVYLVAQAAMLVQNKFLTRFYRSITVSSKDENFRPVLEFLSQHCVADQPSLMMTTSKKKRRTYQEWKAEWLGTAARAVPMVDFLPSNLGSDIHVFEYHGVRFLMSRSVGQTITTGHDRKPLDLETITLSTWGKDNTALKGIIYDALRAAVKVQTEEFNVFVLSNGWMSGWERALSKKPRTLDSVVLDEDLSAELLADAKTFLDSADWYSARGIPYRRGYLLYGAPGCGKTSFCQVLAGALKLDVCMLNLTSENLDDNSLAGHLRDAPINAVILLEDVDAVFTERSAVAGTGSAGGKRSGVSFSGLLNALDGVASQEGRLFMMTTNHLERLDPALVRPGRCDVKVELKKASKVQMSRLLKRFFPEATDEHARAFAAFLPAGELSMAALQGYLLEHKTLSSALENTSRLLQDSKPQVVQPSPVWDVLRRVGLEGLTPAFEYHGFHTRASLVDVGGADAVSKWVPLLSYDEISRKRLGRLLTDDDDLLQQDYAWADMSTVRESFVWAFATGSEAAGRKGKVVRAEEKDAAFTDHSVHESAETMDLPPPSLRRSASSGLMSLTRTPSQDARETELGHLCTAFVTATSRGGKSICSLYQLRRILSLADGDPRRALALAEEVAKPRAKLEAGGIASGCYLDGFVALKRAHLGAASNTASVSAFKDPAGHWRTFRPLSAGLFLRLCGLGEYESCLGPLGIDTVDDLLAVTQDKPDFLKKVIVPDPNELAEEKEKEKSNGNSGGKDSLGAGILAAVAQNEDASAGSEVRGSKLSRSARDRALLSLLLRPSPDRANLCRGLVCPDASELRVLLGRAFRQQTTPAQIGLMVDALTDGQGNGCVSYLQIEKFLVGDNAATAVAGGAAAPAASDTSLSPLPFAALLARVHTELVHRFVPPPAVASTALLHDPRVAWLTSWLTSSEAKAAAGNDVGFPELVSIFSDAGLYSKEDLLMEPRIDAGQLERLGITKLGMQRRIDQMIVRLQGNTKATAVADSAEKKP